MPWLSRSLKKKKLLDFQNLSPHILRRRLALVYIENGEFRFFLTRNAGHAHRTTTLKGVRIAVGLYDS
jgi:hypothetical protein